MLKKPLLLINLFICLHTAAPAQQVYTIKGVVSKKLTTDRVAQVNILNLRSGIAVKSDNIGWFTVKAAIGDTLLFTRADYTSQKIAVTSPNDLPVYLQPVINLDEVKIRGQSKKQELNDVVNDYRNKGIYYDGKPPLSAFSPFGGSPVTAIYELFSKDVKNEQHFINYSRAEAEHAEVVRRYNLSVVKRVTNAPDSTARKFMEYYTPSFDDLKEWNDYELIKHIRKSYDYYDKTTDKERLQQINAPSFLKRKRDSL